MFIIMIMIMINDDNNDSYDQSWYLKCLNFRGNLISREFNFADVAYYLMDFADLIFADFADYPITFLCSLLFLFL